MPGIIFTLKMGKDSAYELANILKSIDNEVVYSISKCIEKIAMNCEETDDSSEFRILVNKTGEFEDENTTCPECGEEMEKIYKCFECGYSYDE